MPEICGVCCHLTKYASPYGCLDRPALLIQQQAWKESCSRCHIHISWSATKSPGTANIIIESSTLHNTISMQISDAHLSRIHGGWILLWLQLAATHLARLWDV